MSEITDAVRAAREKVLARQHARMMQIKALPDKDLGKDVRMDHLGNYQFNQRPNLVYADIQRHLNAEGVALVDVKPLLDTGFGTMSVHVVRASSLPTQLMVAKRTSELKYDHDHAELEFVRCLQLLKCPNIVHVFDWKDPSVLLMEAGAMTLLHFMRSIKVIGEMTAQTFMAFAVQLMVMIWTVSHLDLIDFHFENVIVVPCPPSTCITYDFGCVPTFGCLLKLIDPGAIKVTAPSASDAEDLMHQVMEEFVKMHNVMDVCAAEFAVPCIREMASVFSTPLLQPIVTRIFDQSLPSIASFDIGGLDVSIVRAYMVACTTVGSRFSAPP